MPDPRSTPAPAAADAEALLALMRGLYADVHRCAPPTSVTLDSLIDRDLGFDSLARVELLLRVERSFGLRMPDSALESVERARDLLALMAQSRTRRGPRPTRTDAVERPGDGLDREPPHVLASLNDSLLWHAQRQPGRTQIQYLADGDAATAHAITCAELAQQAEAIAAGLQALGLERGQTVAIMLPTEPDYFFTYFGVLLAGGVPVPIYPPFRRTQIEEHVQRHAGILVNAQCAVLVTMPQALGVARLLKLRVPDLRSIVTADELRAQRGRFVPVAIAGGDIAFIQYTSGSTGQPKGVVLTHANLLANIRAIGEWIRFAADDVIVSWLPLYHDMGLIAAWLAGMHFGTPLVVMPPQAFLLRPPRWLWAIDRFRGTLGAAPNFAFELCLKRIDDEQIRGLDLSSLRVLANGSEQVQAATIDRFTQRFGRYGFRSEAMVPVYGLAENTVGVAAPALGRPPRIDRVVRERFLRDGRAVPAAADDAGALRFVGCGMALPGHALRIVDDRERPLPERAVGGIEFRGPSATQGYYRNEALTRRLIRGDWLDSGDRGYLADGELFVTGRVKDIIVRGGRNLYPDEIEQAVGDLAGIRRGCVCAFGSADPATGTERLVVVAETAVTAADRRIELREAIVRTTVDLLGEPPDEVVLTPPGSVLKTSSGKLRRTATRERYEAGVVGAPMRAAGWQVARLLRASLLPQARRLLRGAAQAAYAAYAWTLFGLLAPCVWLLTVLAAEPGRAWSVSRGAARLLLRLAAIGVEVRGAPATVRARVYVVNHASYIDGLVLLAVLPHACRFVAKAELRSGPIARRYLQSLGAEFVERFDIQRSVRDSGRLLARAKGGDPLLFFPEGTFVGAPGVLPFYLGAFVTAVKADVEVVPVALRGTRAILRGSGRIPHRGDVVVTFGEPLAPAAGTGDAFSAALALRDRARAHIVAHCGEPDLAVPGTPRTPR